MMVSIQSHSRRGLTILSLWLALIAGTMRDASAQSPPPKSTGPWDVTRLLGSASAMEWGTPNGEVRPVFYEGEPLGGKPTRIFAYYARPTGNGPFPAMLLVHGGGGKAFREWAELWAKRGYVALAMDLSGRGPDSARLPDGGPEQDDDTKFRDFDDSQVKDMWTYHAVAAVLRGHALLASLKEVDSERIGVTGISWGGYLTCIVAGIDTKLKVAVPVYGCGFLDEDSCWLPRFKAMSADQRKRWVENFDPSRYLPGVECPILFVNGTNDFAYPLGSYQSSYRLVRAPRTLLVTVNMPHGHSQGWSPKEIGLFVDSVLKGGEPLARVSSLVMEGGRVKVTVNSKTPIVSASLHFTKDIGPWQQREWTTVKAKKDGDHVEAILPFEEAQAWFLTVTDSRGAVVSSEHLELAGPR